MPGTDDGTKKIAPVDEPTKPDAPAKPDTPADGGKKGEEKLYLGKYKSAEEAEKGHSDLEKKLGSQGQELGALRNEVAQNRAAQAEKAKTDKETPATDYDAKLNEIYEKLEAGDISVTEAVKQSNSLTAEMTMAKAVAVSDKRTQDLLLDKDAEAAETDWHKTYSDYNEVVASGVLQPFMDANPILVDETVAYFQYKADQRFEEGKAEAERIAKGADEADTVVKETGVANKTPTRQDPISDDKMLASQMETLKKIRGQA